MSHAGRPPVRDRTGTVRVGPGSLPSRETAARAIELLLAGGYDAAEIDFGDGFWMDWDYAHDLKRAARRADVALSIHAPLAAFLGHAEYGGRKHHMAIGMLDHTAGLAIACGAEPVVIHPGFLLGRERGQAIEDVVIQLAELRERLAAKDRAVPFGVEVMGRVRELGSLDDVIEICQRLKPLSTDAAALNPDDWVRPVIDFAHLHATSDGAFTTPDAFAAALSVADRVLAPGVPFHIHFSDISFANRNEKAHLPYGQGTLRAEPLMQALAGFARRATVIAESPDEASNQKIRAILQSPRPLPA
jgi:deoxyribonuclease IV